MELPEQAARALEVVRRDGRDLRYEIDEICHSDRFRLSIRYVRPGGEELRLGLLYSADRAVLEALRGRLAAEGRD